MTYKEAAQKNGTVNFDGEEIAIMQTPFPSDLIDWKNHFEALGKDSDGNEFRIFWPFTEALMSGEFVNDGDECDWDSARIVKL
jgi:hypothetical protein